MTQLTFKRQKLIDALDALKSTVVERPKKGRLYTSYVRITADSECATLTTTDLTAWTETRVTIYHTSAGMFDTCIPFYDLMRLIRKVKAQVIVLDLIDDKVNVEIDGGTVTLPTLTPALFPLRPAIFTSDISTVYIAQDILKALDFVLPAVSRDETRPHICSVGLLKGRLAATDGHRLHIANIYSYKLDEVSIPTNSARALRRLCQFEVKNDLWVEIKYDRNEDNEKLNSGVIRFIGKKGNLTSRLVSQEFPPIDQVIPDQTHQYRIASREIHSALSLLKDETVKISANCVIDLEIDTLTRKFKRRINPTFSPNCELIETGINSKYLREAVNVDDKEIRLQITGVSDPIRIDHETGLAVIMPVRL